MKKSILIVDAELHMVQLLKKTIRGKSQHRIKSTHNALELPKILADEHFDLIISEMDMPGFNGLDLLRKIESEKRNEIVIITSAHSDIDKIITAFRMGASDILIKPFKAEVLFNSIERAIAHFEQRHRSCCMKEMMNTAPFEQAIDVFKSEYVKCLLNQASDDIGKVANRSGLSRLEIEAILKKMTK